MILQVQFLAQCFQSASLRSLAKDHAAGRGVEHRQCVHQVVMGFLRAEAAYRYDLGADGRDLIALAFVQRERLDALAV